MTLRRQIAVLAGATCLLPFAATAQAQDFNDPTRFELRVSGFHPQADVRMAGDGTATLGERSATFGADASLDVGSSWRPRVEATFHLAPRHALHANYYDYKRRHEWGFAGDWIDPGTVFDEVDLPGDPVEVPGVDLSGELRFRLASLNYDYALLEGPALSWGVGVGLTRAILSADARGRTTGTDELDPAWDTLQWKRDGTSPSLHTRLTWAPAPRWRVEAQGQYFDTRWGNFVRETGHFERAGVLAEYLLTDRIALHAGYDWFRLKLADDYRGAFDAPAEAGGGTVDVVGRLSGQVKVHGPMAGLSIRF
ncbi:MAG: hypothetical protein LCH70_05195 [Proteobacteria bacterium]|nr:hypothetical protein [Pseudomonadota bacterium]